MRSLKRVATAKAYGHLGLPVPEKESIIEKYERVYKKGVTHVIQKFDKGSDRRQDLYAWWI